MIRAVLCLLLVPLGVMLLATPYAIIGAVFLGAAALFHKGMSGQSEDRFQTTLLVLGGAGALAVAAQFVIERLRTIL